MRPTPDADDRDPAPSAARAVHAERAACAADLRGAFAALPLAVERASCAVREVPVPSYAGGPRPSSTALLEGRGAAGRGEHVGWTIGAHRAFAHAVAALDLGACATVGALAALAARTLDHPYDRAALEAAAIDLALRQAGTDPCRASARAARPVRYVLSFERVAEPVARARNEPDGLALKIDADPEWSDATYSGLAALGRVAVLDFKLSGAPRDHERAHALLPGALLEDPLPAREPWSASLRRRLSLDAEITSAAAVAALSEPPAAVNVKPARIGGVLEALAVVEACAVRGIEVYFGGMFEVDVGRRQLQLLASLLCPDGPNDVAPIALTAAPPPRPERLLAGPRDAGFAAW